ncbi:MAG: VCBS repeat-containing protein [Nitrospirae bacterium]|nr:VCBS repeat-containing protein [Nitrospirota bacterium]
MGLTLLLALAGTPACSGEGHGGQLPSLVLLTPRVRNGQEIKVQVRSFVEGAEVTIDASALDSEFGPTRKTEVRTREDGVYEAAYVVAAENRNVDGAYAVRVRVRMPEGDFAASEEFTVKLENGATHGWVVSFEATAGEAAGPDGYRSVGRLVVAAREDGVLRALAIRSRPVAGPQAGGGAVKSERMRGEWRLASGVAGSEVLDFTPGATADGQPKWDVALGGEGLPVEKGMHRWSLLLRRACGEAGEAPALEMSAEDVMVVNGVGQVIEVQGVPVTIRIEEAVSLVERWSLSLAAFEAFPRVLGAADLESSEWGDELLVFGGHGGRRISRIELDASAGAREAGRWESIKGRRLVSAATANLDGDEKVDVIATDETGGIQVFFNADAEGRMPILWTGEPGLEVVGGTFDADGNGLGDYAFFNKSTGSLWIGPSRPDGVSKAVGSVEAPPPLRSGDDDQNGHAVLASPTFVKGSLGQGPFAGVWAVDVDGDGVSELMAAASSGRRSWMTLYRRSGETGRYEGGRSAGFGKGALQFSGPCEGCDREDGAWAAVVLDGGEVKLLHVTAQGEWAVAWSRDVGRGARKIAVLPDGDVAVSISSGVVVLDSGGERPVTGVDREPDWMGAARARGCAGCGGDFAVGYEEGLDVVSGAGGVWSVSRSSGSGFYPTRVATENGAGLWFAGNGTSAQHLSVEYGRPGGLTAVSTKGRILGAAALSGGVALLQENVVEIVGRRCPPAGRGSGAGSGQDGRPGLAVECPEQGREVALPKGEWSAIASGDLDGDGENELVVAPKVGGRWLFMKDEGGPLASSDLGVRAERIFVEDLDGDGLAEIVALMEKEGAMAVIGFDVAGRTLRVRGTAQRGSGMRVLGWAGNGRLVAAGSGSVELVKIEMSDGQIAVKRSGARAVTGLPLGAAEVGMGSGSGGPEPSMGVLIDRADEGRALGLLSGEAAESGCLGAVVRVDADGLAAVDLNGDGRKELIAWSSTSGVVKGYEVRP